VCALLAAGAEKIKGEAKPRASEQHKAAKKWNRSRARYSRPGAGMRIARLRGVGEDRYAIGFGTDHGTVAAADQSELASHYFHAALPRQFDEWVWFDETRAVDPLGVPAEPGKLPETFRSASDARRGGTRLAKHRPWQQTTKTHRTTAAAPNARAKTRRSSTPLGASRGSGNCCAG
jgi:hypothetical protein